jgi:excinuclease UvrABC nuclease subunit
MINPETLDLSTLPSLPLSDRKQLPTVSCIYFAMSNGVVQYIGKSTNLKDRWRRHQRTQELSIDSCIAWIEVSNPELLTEIEKALISWFNPPLNGSKVDYSLAGKKRSLVTLYLEEETRKDLESFAKSQKRSMSASIEILIIEAVKKAKKQGVIE